jgi:hypothetical protein
MQQTILFPGKVEWSGENPGISLKEDPNGPFTTLASFFRVVLSPHGAGHALVLMQSPHEANPPEAAANWCLTDNEPLARWLIAEYLSHFGAFRGIAGLAGLRFRKLDEVKTAGDPRSHYSESVRAGDMTVSMAWQGLGEPFCFAFAPPQSATGKHVMPSLFIGCESAAVTVNGIRRPGAPIPREVAGRKISTAMLAFCETWLRV